MTDTQKLRDKIEKSGLKLTYVAERIGVTYQGLLNKINNKTEFKVSEIQTICSLLSLNESERDAIFFAKEVGKMPTNG